MVQSPYAPYALYVTYIFGISKKLSVSGHSDQKKYALPHFWWEKTVGWIFLATVLYCMTYGHHFFSGSLSWLPLLYSTCYWIRGGLSQILKKKMSEEWNLFELKSTLVQKSYSLHSKLNLLKSTGKHMNERCKYEPTIQWFEKSQ